MLAQSLNDRRPLALIFLSSLLGLLLGYAWSAQFWNPIAHITTESIAGTTALSGFWIALIVAFVFGCMRSLMGCSNTLVLALPTIMENGRSAVGWIVNITNFSIGAVIASGVLGALFGLFGSAILDLINTSPAKIAIASGTQIIVGLLILVLAVAEYRSITLPRAPLKFYPSNPFMMGFVLGGVSNLGCPSPIFYGLVAWVAASGNVVYGITVMVVHSIGRILPMAVCGSMIVGGIGFQKFSQWVVDHQRQMKILSASGLAMMGTFLISYWYIFLEQKFPGAG